MSIPLQNNPLLFINLQRAQDLGNPFVLHLTHDTTSSRVSYVCSLIQLFQITDSVLNPILFTSSIPNEYVIKIPATFLEDTETTYTGYAMIPSKTGSPTPHSITGLEVLLTSTNTFPHLDEGSLTPHINQRCGEANNVCDACIYRLDAQELLRDYFKELDPDNLRFREVINIINHCVRARINKWSQSRPPSTSLSLASKSAENRPESSSEDGSGRLTPLRIIKA